MRAFVFKSNKIKIHNSYNIPKWNKNAGKEKV